MVTTRRSAAANKTQLLPVLDNPERIKSHPISEKKSKSSITKTEKEALVAVKKINKDDTESEEGSESDSENEDSDDEEDSEDNEDSSESEESDNDDDDLNDLLKKAQLSLKEKQDSILKLDEKVDPYKQTNFKLPKLNPGVNPEEELYIKENEKSAAKLGSNIVSVIESGSSPENNKALVTLQKVEGNIKYPSRKERQLEREKTTGKGWFDMPRTEITPEIKRDLEILKMRHILDRKRHYKKMGKNANPTYFQVGTVIEGATEFFSSRINKKDRKRTFVDEILGNDEQREYYRNKYLTSQQAKSSGGKKHYKKLKAKRSL